MAHLAKNGKKRERESENSEAWISLAMSVVLVVLCLRLERCGIPFLFLKGL